MDNQSKALKLGALAISFALFLRLFGGIVQTGRAVFQDPGVLSFAVFLQTGRVVRFPVAVPLATLPASTAEPEQEVIATEPLTPDKPAFSAQDLQTFSLLYGCDYRPDLEALIQAPLDWDLRDAQPRVLIIHTHATESYAPTPGAEYTLSGERHTLQEQYNMLSIGDEIARILEEGGIRVLHDRTLHDHPSYNGSYESARQAIAAYLEQYPSITMVLDIHRDAISSDAGAHLTTSATVNGQPAAQIMTVIGTDASGTHHPNWQTNLALGLKLTAQLERIAPGITRGLYLRSSRFNGDMTPGSLLLEVGASGDTHAQALLAAQVLAQGVLALAGGSQ